jgi:site-specific recombinase XerD
MKNPSVNFYLIKRNNNSEKQQNLYRIIMSVSFGNKRLIHYTGILSNFIDWDKDLQQFTGINPDYLNLNAFLNNLRQSAVNIYCSISIKDSFVNINEFRRQLKKFKISPGYELIDALIRFMELNYKSWADSTYRKCKSLLNHLIRFRKSGHVTLILEAVDKEFMTNLVSYFKAQGLKHSSVRGYLNIMNWFLNWCVKQRMMINTNFRDFQLSNIHISEQESSKQDFYLNQEELSLLIKGEFEEIKIERVRDMFLFMVFSGCRFSEMILLKKEHINVDYIYFSGRNERKFPQNNFTRNITIRYQNKYYRDNRFFPAFSNITFNKYLRIMANQLGFERIVKRKINGHDLVLKDNLTVNTASDTFLVNSILMDISLTQIQKWTGRNLEAKYKFLRNKLVKNEEAAINKLNSFYLKVV